MGTLFLFGLMAMFVLAAVTDPHILGSIRMNGRRYRKGDEADLQAVMTPAQHDDFQKRGLIQGQWGVSDTGEATSTPATAERAVTPDELNAYLIEELSPAVFELNGEETVLDALRRIIGERNEAQAKIAQLEQDMADVTTGAQTSEDALRAQIGDLEGQLKKVQAELAEAKKAAKK